jgi:hypothetical protein
MDETWNRFGNKLTAYGEGYHYTNADGSKYYSNPDGSKFYDPGLSGKGRKWYCSPDGEKEYIDDDDDDDDEEDDSDDSDDEDDEEEMEYRESQNQGISYRDSYRGYHEEYNNKSPRTNQIKQESSPPRTQPRPRQTARKSIVKRNLPQPPQLRSPRKPLRSKEKEIHIHVHPREPPPPMNVTRVVHHSSRGEKEIVYKSPVKVAKDGKIGKEKKKVVHIHHYKR